MNEEFSFIHYLASKKSVDDRALNGFVWQRLIQALPEQKPRKPLRVLELGVGIGTMIERMITWNALNFADYTAIDQQSENIAHTSQRLLEWAFLSGYQATIINNRNLLIQDNRLKISINLETNNLFNFISHHRLQQKWDLIIAHAFLDLINLSETLPQLLDLLAEDGLFYFTINYDGVTIFEPEIDIELDKRIQLAYHQTMDNRTVGGKPSGDSETGRHLFTQLQNAGGKILAAGASDWVVYPNSEGYDQDEAYFLHFIIHTIHQALKDHPEINTDELSRWIAERHRQIDHQQLIYIAHQLDLLGSTIKK